MRASNTVTRTHGLMMCSYMHRCMNLDEYDRVLYIGTTWHQQNRLADDMHVTY